MNDHEITLPRQLRQASGIAEVIGWLTIGAGLTLPTLLLWWIVLIPVGIAVVGVSWRMRRWAAQAQQMSADLIVARLTIERRS